MTESNERVLMKVPDIFSYIVAVDSGFAPNVQGRVCTLACCKPDIRRTAKIGDWVIGTTPVSLTSGRLVYAMRVGRGLTFDYYFNSPEYAHKKPNSKNSIGDNIYKQSSNGAWEQLPNDCHCTDDINHDTQSNRVLIADEFYYFGKEAPMLPSLFQSFVHTTQKHKIIRGSDEEQNIEAFINWLRTQYAQGIHGEPANYKEKCNYSTTNLISC